MTTLRQAAEQALEALMYCEPHCDENPLGFQRWADAMPALREALAQRELVGLTDEEVKKEVEIEMEYYWGGDYIKTTGARDQLKGFARTIEAKLKEKNT